MTIHVEDIEMTKAEIIVAQGRHIRWLTLAVVLLVLFSGFMCWMSLESQLMKCDNITTDWTGNGKDYCITEIKE